MNNQQNTETFCKIRPRRAHHSCQTINCFQPVIRKCLYTYLTGVQGGLFCFSVK